MSRFFSVGPFPCGVGARFGAAFCAVIFVAVTFFAVAFFAVVFLEVVLLLISAPELALDRSTRFRARRKGAGGSFDICRYGHIFLRPMARAATTSDAFNAVAEPQRRRILALLKGRERPVNELARALRITQPRTSKHLRVLREVGLVRVREAGQQRLYGLDARRLQPVHERVGGFEQFWGARLDRLNEDAKERQKERTDGSGS